MKRLLLKVQKGELFTLRKFKIRSINTVVFYKLYSRPLKFQTKLPGREKENILLLFRGLEWFDKYMRRRVQ